MANINCLYLNEELSQYLISEDSIVFPLLQVKLYMYVCKSNTSLYDSLYE